MSNNVHFCASNCAEMGYDLSKVFPEVDPIISSYAQALFYKYMLLSDCFLKRKREFGIILMKNTKD